MMIYLSTMTYLSETEITHISLAKLTLGTPQAKYGKLRVLAGKTNLKYKK